MTIYFSLHRDFKGEETYLFVSQSESWSRFLEDGFLPLPCLNDSMKEAFLQKFEAVLKEWRCCNEHSEWFHSTAFARGDIGQFDFFLGFENLERLDALIQRTSSDEDVFIIFDDVIWFEFACRKYSDVAYFQKNQKERQQYFLKVLYAKYQGIRFLLEKMRFFSKQKSKKDPDVEYSLISIWFEKNISDWKHKRRDPFWGIFPTFLSDHKKAFKICYLPEENSDYEDENCTSCSSYVGISDFIFIVCKILIACWREPVSEFYPADAVRKDLVQSFYAQVPWALYTYKATLNIIKNHPKATLLHPYEGNAWEYGIAMAAKRNPELSVSVYQHGAILPSYFKMKYKSGSLWNPDKILASGTESKNILINEMGHPSNSIHEGCDFRNNGFSASMTDKPLSKKRVLVLLQGLKSDYFMLYCIDRYIGINENFDIVLRDHPSMPLDSKFVPENYKRSKIDDLDEDIEMSSLVLYNGSTAVFQALVHGVPAIHVDIGLAVNHDPLFQFQSCGIKKTWYAGQDDFQPLYDEIKSLSFDAYKQEQKKAAEYASRYFSPPSNEFINQNLTGVLL